MDRYALLKLARLMLATLLLDAVMLCLYLAYRDALHVELAFTALAFGHANVGAIWLAAGRPGQSAGWRAAQAAVLLGIVLFTATATFIRHQSAGAADWASLVVCFAAPAAATAAIAWCWFAVQRRGRDVRSTGGLRIRYSMRFLLALMTFSALLSGLLTQAKLEGYWRGAVILGGNALAVATAALILSSVPVHAFVRLALLLATAAALGLAGRFYAGGLSGELIELNLIQAFFLAAWLRWGGILPPEDDTAGSQARGVP